MAPLRLALACSLLLAACLCVLGTSVSSLPSVSLSASSPSLTHQSLTRTIDLRSHVEEVSVSLTLKNTGRMPVSSYVVSIPGTKAPRLAFLEVHQASLGRDTKLSPLVATPVTVNDLPAASALPSAEALSSLANASFFSVSLSSPLVPGASVELRVSAVFTRTQRPYPESISQGEAQLVWWEDSTVWYTPYNTLSQETVIHLASNKVESYAPKKGGRRAGDEIKYEIEEATTAFSLTPLTVHFVNNAPFVTFTSLSKDIEVSHWGNVAVQDNYILKHTGAALKGEMSRFEYERGRGTGETAPASFRTIVADLPRTATDVYYRDCIGNVSTSHVRRAGRGDATTRAEISPRFPMFGGWESDFNIGYNLPSQHYLSVSTEDSSLYVLNISFASPFATSATDQLVVRVILPEGAEDIAWSTPFDIDSAEMTEFKTYLDTTGRPTLVLSKSNVVRHHQLPFQVSYRFSTLSILREPMLITGAIFALLCVVMAFYHADLRITDESVVTTAGSGVKTRRTGTALGAQVQEILENILARPHGLLALAEERSARPALLASMSSELLAALKALEAEDSAFFGPVVTSLTNSVGLLARASAKYAAASASGSGGAEAKAARESLANVVEQIQAQAQKLAQI